MQEANKYPTEIVPDVNLSPEERALNHFKAMVVLQPKVSDHFMKLGDSFCLMEQYRNAIYAFQKAVSLSPGDP